MSKKEEKVGEEGTYTTKIKFKCPKRGIVEQEVVVRKFTPQAAPETKGVDSTISELLNQEEVDEDT